MAETRISVIIPTYNERHNLAPLISRIETALSGLDWEVIFVDDNSKDGTHEEAFRISQVHSRVRLILRLSDRGLARSSIQGMLSAKGNYLCIMDGDGQHDPKYIPQMIDRLQADQLDIISASRKLDEISGSQSLSRWRTRMSRVGNFFSSRVIGRVLNDPLTGFFLMKREAFMALAPGLSDPGFKLLLDILSSNHRLKHAELPFNFGTRMSGDSKLDSYVAWQFGTFLVSKATGSLIPAKLVSFILVGFTGLAVHFCGLYAGLFMGLSFKVAQTLATLIAATTNFAFNNLLTFRDRRLRGIGMLWGYLKYLLASAFGIAANISVAVLTYERFGHLVVISTLAGIAIDTLWKFVISNRMIWK